MSHQVRVRAGHPDLVLEDGTTLHQPGDVITLSDEAFARLPQSVFGTVLDDLGEVEAAGGSPSPTIVTWNMSSITGLPVNITVYDPDGTSHSITESTDPAFPAWMMTDVALDGFWVKSNKKLRAFLVVTGGSSSDAGYGASIRNSAFPGVSGKSGANFTLRTQGDLIPPPPGWETGGPNSEPGWDVLQSSLSGTEGNGTTLFGVYDPLS